jgi:Pentapeptide repeats (8 copies)
MQWQLVAVARCRVGELSSAWLVQATLRGADLSRCDLHKAQARTCDAQNAIFRGARLERADFEDSDLRGADLSKVRFGRASLSGADLRGADLSGAEFGGKPGPTDLEDVRLAGCRVAGATGRVYGPVDIGADTPNLVGGGDLHDWFASQGAPLVEVTTLKS